jgi:DNA repair protein SbcD/Mre11
MAVKSLRVLLLADTHLGIDWAAKPRVQRHRRSDDFLANTLRALAPARSGKVDIVVHGGDLLYRSKVSAALVQMALEPFFEVADLGVPVFLVPGNHERSRIPFRILAAHKGVYIFDRASTFELETGGLRVGLSGFPCNRDTVRHGFLRQLEGTGWTDNHADIRLLCIHQAVEGATIGPHGYMFRHAPDVVRGCEIPAGFAAVLAGHIHRHQVLTHRPNGIPMMAPVFYPGSVERTSRAERLEKKGFLELEIGADGQPGGRVRRWVFTPLPTRPVRIGWHRRA